LKTPDNEAERLRILEELRILDSPRERFFDDLAFLAANVCDTPIALVTLVDGSRQWFKARIGLETSETPRDVAFCAHAILGDDISRSPTRSRMIGSHATRWSSEFRTSGSMPAPR